MRHPNNGFSLVEIIVIITLLGTLSFGALIGINKQFAKARDAQRKMNIKTIVKSLEEYYDSVLCYPDALPACGDKLYLDETVMLDSLPCDPRTHESYRYVTDNNPGCASYFKIYANLENREDTDIKYVGCQYGCGPNCGYNYGASSPNTFLDQCEAPVNPTPTDFIPIVSEVPTPTGPAITITEGPSPTWFQDLQYVCAPGIGQDGHCTAFSYPDLSECPRIWINDPTCNNECDLKQNHCKTSKGKKPN